MSRLQRAALWGRYTFPACCCGPQDRHPQSRAYARGDIAQKFSQAGDHAKTHEVLDEADQVAQKIPQPDQRRMALEKARSLTGTLPRPPK